MVDKNAFNALTDREFAVLYWKAQGYTHKYIGEKWGYEEVTIQKLVSSAHLKLGIPKDMHPARRAELLEKEIYPAFREWIENHPEKVKALPEPEAEEKVDPETETVYGEPVDDIPEPSPVVVPVPIPPRRFPFWILGCGLLVLLGLAGVAYAGYRFLPFLAVPTQTFNPQIIHTVSPTSTVEPTITDTPTPVATLTETMTPTITPTFTPTLAPTKELYEQDDPAYLTPDIFLYMNPDFGPDNFALCYAPNPGFNLLLEYVNNSTEQFSLRFDKSQFHVFDDTGKEYPVETSGNGRCDAEPGIKESTIPGGANGHMYIGVSGSIGLDVNYLILKVDNISGYGPFSFKKDL